MSIIKRCHKCGIDRPLEDFHMSRHSRDGRQGACKGCAISYSKAYQATRRDFTKDYDRNRNLGRYGLSVILYENLLKAQDYRCASCDRPQAEFTTNFVVDHDHSCCPEKKMSCGKCVRGLICNNCNIGLGHVNDSVDRLLQMAAYLLKFEDVLKMEMN